MMRATLFAALLACAATFVFLSAESLPPLVAAHFRAGGAADGFMPRQGYVLMILILAVGAPLLVLGLASVVRAVPTRFINLPHREYWLAPERRDASLDFLVRHGRWLAILLAAFLCFVHALVVRANAAHPPLFPERVFFSGLAAFAAALVVWIAAFAAHFRHR